MQTMLATIAEGEFDKADLCLLIALILFIVLGVLEVIDRAVKGVLLSAGLALVALALMLW